MAMTSALHFTTGILMIIRHHFRTYKMICTPITLPIIAGRHAHILHSLPTTLAQHSHWITHGFNTTKHARHPPSSTLWLSLLNVAQ